MTIYPTQKSSTYHLDQNVRGLISKDRIKPKFLDKYYHETILPFAVLEYTGIEIKKVLSKICPPKISKPLDLQKIKEYFDEQVESKLPKKNIEIKLKERLKYDNDYAKPFAEGCMKALSKPGFYELIVNQLSWDRFSQMKWIGNDSGMTLREIRINIAKLIIKYKHLYILRHCEYLSKVPPDFPLNEDQDFLMETMQVKIKPNMDIGDCELIHVAINGQSSDLKKRRSVDCYTMDDAKEIKRRLISCIFFYQMLEDTPFNSGYKFDPTYFGKIYIIDEKGQKTEKISVADYEPNKVLMRKKTQDLNTLFLLNN